MDVGDAAPNGAGLGLDSGDEDGGGGSEAPPPPPVGGQTFSSASLRQSHLWGRNPPQRRGNGGGGGGGGPAAHGVSDGGGPRFERLSSLCLEVDLRQNADGGASSLFSEDDEYQGDVLASKRAGKKKKKQKRDTDEVSVMAPSEQDGGDGVERAGSDDDDDDGDGNGEKTRRGPRGGNKQKAASSSAQPQSEAAAALAAAAFGGTAPPAHDSDSESDDGSLFSANTEAKKRAHKAAFPIRGVTCIGCAMPHKIQCVEKFVLENISRMSSDALWKHAALVWKLEVVDRAKREGNVVPDWGWKELQSHFLLHCSNPVISRQSTITQLQLMRTTVENRLVRVEEDGSRELDKVGADLMLKIIKQESSERTLLANLMGGGTGVAGGKAGKAGGGPTVGDVGK